MLNYLFNGRERVNLVLKKQFPANVTESNLKNKDFIFEL